MSKFKQTDIGLIPEDWEIFFLRELCIKITDGSHFSPKTVSNGFPIATVRDMNENDFNLSTCRKISCEDFLKLSKLDCKPLINDVLIAKDGSYLKHVFVFNGNYEIVILSSIAILRPKISKIDPFFLKYLFKDPNVKERVSGNYVSGAVIPRIILKDFEKILLPVPSLIEQKAIAKVLSDLDSKIELLQKQNEILEEIGKTLFKRWFVDFEFPNDENEGKPYKSSGGEMIESELGLIPKGWEVDFFKKISKIQPGYAFKSSDFKESGIGLVKIKNIQNNVISLEFDSFVSEELYNRVDDKFKLVPGDVLIAMTGAMLGKTGMIPKTNKKLLLNQRVGKINSNWKYFTYLNMISNPNINQFIKSFILSSSAQGNISNSDIENLRIIIPDNKIMILFDSLINSIYIKTYTNLGEILKLQETRDALLPKLMSGQIRVKM